MRMKVKGLEERGVGRPHREALLFSRRFPPFCKLRFNLHSAVTFFKASSYPISPVLPVALTFAKQVVVSHYKTKAIGAERLSELERLDN